jgi:S1-C subfamily serine protease
MRIERDGVIRTIDVELTAKFVAEDNEVMLGRYRDTENLGKYASVHNSGFPEAMQHDTDLFPDQCGGPLFDLSGKAVGLNIARAARIASYALPAHIVVKAFEDMKKQDVPKQLKKAS